MAMTKDTPLEPAATVITRIGEGCFTLGVRRVSEITGHDETWVRRWAYPQSRRGRDGRVPERDIPKLLEWARENHIRLSGNDFFPQARRSTAA
jgi:hypothetical protein